MHDVLIARTVVVDLDGVLAQYTHWKGPLDFGEPIAGARDFLRKLTYMNYHIVIHTARIDDTVDIDLVTAAVCNWLTRHDMPYGEVWNRRGKPTGVAYVDDRAVPCCPQGGSSIEYEIALSNIEYRKKVAK